MLFRVEVWIHHVVCDTCGLREWEVHETQTTSGSWLVSKEGCVNGPNTHWNERDLETLHIWGCTVMDSFNYRIPQHMMHLLFGSPLLKNSIFKILDLD